MKYEPIARISNENLSTSIGVANRWPVVKWSLNIPEEDCRVKWLHGFKDYDISGRLAVLMPDRSKTIQDDLIEDDICV